MGEFGGDIDVAATGPDDVGGVSAATSIPSIVAAVLTEGDIVGVCDRAVDDSMRGTSQEYKNKKTFQAKRRWWWMEEEEGTKNLCRGGILWDKWSKRRSRSEQLLRGTM